MSVEFMDAEFVFPELNKSARGQFYLLESGSYFVLFENPLGFQEFTSIGLTHVTTIHAIYTCVESVMYRRNGTGYYYRISELYEDAHIGEATIPNCTRLQADISFLITWLQPKMLHIQELENENHFAVVNILNSKNWQFALLPNIYIHFEAFTSINAKQQEISLTEQSAVTITADEPIARNELFGHFYSFLIFFLLFVRKSPTTSRLSFHIQEKEVELLSLPAKTEEQSI